MRQRTPENEKIVREGNKVLAVYRDDFPTCQMVGCQHRGDEIHHIFRGALKIRTYSEFWAVLHVCRNHHRQLDDKGQWHVIRQLALKRNADRVNGTKRKHLDLNAVHKFLGREVYDEWDIDDELDRIKGWYLNGWP